MRAVRLSEKVFVQRAVPKDQSRCRPVRAVVTGPLFRSLPNVRYPPGAAARPEPRTKKRISQLLLILVLVVSKTHIGQEAVAV